MSVLNFQRNADGEYEVAINNVQSAINVNIKRKKNAALIIQQRGTSDGAWCDVRVFHGGAKSDFDFNLVSDYYPMNWKIISACSVESASYRD